jgi:hypothetical protein
MITGISWSGGYIAFTFNAVPSDVVFGSFFTVSGVVPTAYNASWQVVSVVGNVVTVASASNPGVYSSGGTVATSTLPNPFPSDGNGNWFCYVPNTVYTVIYHDTFGRVPDQFYPDQYPMNPGGGSVTSVGLSVPSIFQVSGPITTSGTIALTYSLESANTVFAGPISGPAAAPTFRPLTAADIAGLGAGSVTSVAQTVTVPAYLSAVVTGSPITTTGTLAIAITANTQSANTVLAGPVSGGLGAPSYRALVAADLPALSASSLTNGIAGTGAVILANNATFLGVTTIPVLDITGHLDSGISGSPASANHDLAGTITITGGNTSQSHTFTTAFGAAPVVVVTPTSSPYVAGIGTYWVTSSTTGFVVNCDSISSPPVSITFNYIVIGNPG